MDLVIRNGEVITAGGIFRCDVGVHGERIAAVGDNLHGATEIDAAGCYVIPGAVDPHVHLQMPLGEYVSADSFASGTVAAACGGTTTVIDFVEPDAEETLLDALAARRAEADGAVVTDYGLHMTIPAWHARRAHALSQIPEVLAAGCSSFKMYMAYGGLMLDDVSLYTAMAAVGKAGGLPIVHCENGAMCELMRSVSVASGRVAPVNHAFTRPPRQEAEATSRAIDIAALAGSPVYIVHVSCAESLVRVKAARARCDVVYGETCPQYLLLDRCRLKEGNGERLICAPPLRTAADHDALWRALACGELDVLSTDHCPFAAADKAGHPDFTTIPGGLPSIESRLSLAYHFGLEAGLSPERWVEVCCSRPAQIFGLHRKGHIAIGLDADIVIFDPNRIKTLASGRTLHECVDWSPYEGVRLCGWPRHVLSRGRVIVRNEAFTGSSGYGRFVKRRPFEKVL